MQIRLAIEAAEHEQAREILRGEGFQRFHGKGHQTDHNPPPLSTMVQFCAYMSDLLSQVLGRVRFHRVGMCELRLLPPPLRLLSMVVHHARQRTPVTLPLSHIPCGHVRSACFTETDSRVKRPLIPQFLLSSNP